MNIFDKSFFEAQDQKEEDDYILSQIFKTKNKSTKVMIKPSQGILYEPGGIFKLI
jgi:hypothetical protein